MLKYQLLELMINKFSEFLDWVFDKKKKSDTEELADLDAVLKQKLHFSVFDMLKDSPEDLNQMLQKMDKILLNDIISLLFKISISQKNDEISKNLKSDSNLNKCLMEMILFADSIPDNFSPDRNNIKNSVLQQLRHQKPSEINF